MELTFDLYILGQIFSNIFAITCHQPSIIVCTLFKERNLTFDLAGNTIIKLVLVLWVEIAMVAKEFDVK